MYIQNWAKPRTHGMASVPGNLLHAFSAWVFNCGGGGEILKAAHTSRNVQRGRSVTEGTHGMQEQMYIGVCPFQDVLLGGFHSILRDHTHACIPR